jgi:hypothetical protein
MAKRSSGVSVASGASSAIKKNISRSGGGMGSKRIGTRKVSTQSTNQRVGGGTNAVASTSLGG